MKTQGRPQSNNIVDARNSNALEKIGLAAHSELSGIGTDLQDALSSPFGGPEYLVLPTNYKSGYAPTPVGDLQLQQWRENNGVQAPAASSMASQMSHMQQMRTNELRRSLE